MALRRQHSDDFLSVRQIADEGSLTLSVWGWNDYTESAWIIKDRRPYVSQRLQNDGEIGHWRVEENGNPEAGHPATACTRRAKLPPLARQR